MGGPENTPTEKREGRTKRGRLVKRVKRENLQRRKGKSAIKQRDARAKEKSYEKEGEKPSRSTEREAYLKVDHGPSREWVTDRRRGGLPTFACVHVLAFAFSGGSRARLVLNSGPFLKQLDSFSAVSERQQSPRSENAKRRATKKEQRSENYWGAPRHTARKRPVSFIRFAPIQQPG